MSKSIGNVGDLFEAMQDLGTDLVRYYLARIGVRFKDDVDWSNKQLENNPAELQSLLGNFYLRITSAAFRKRLPEDFFRDLRNSLEQSLKSEHLREVASPLRDLASVVDQRLKELRVSEAQEAIIHQLKAVCPAVSLMDNCELPVALQAKVMRLGPRRCKLYRLKPMRICGILLQPFIPAKASMLLDVMGFPRSERALQHAQYLRSSVGNVTPGVKLFSRVWKKEF
ncbi:hypothetical protein F5148DRAFT_1281797 [Russula earlei]|uniref:Uncharacterized protein n=1 Tax=Russula earlei TaxID=71964 RepID=A0ACC0UHM7_9AGAM|nr:hypothetical protein F5148DRAFT_1281797 [Russula earlei]